MKKGAVMEWYYWALGAVVLAIIVPLYFKKAEPERRRRAMLRFVEQKIEATKDQLVQRDWEKLAQLLEREDDGLRWGPYFGDIWDEAKELFGVKSHHYATDTSGLRAGFTRYWYRTRHPNFWYAAVFFEEESLPRNTILRYRPRPPRKK